MPSKFITASSLTSNPLDSGLSLSVLIAPDKFKGTLTGTQAAKAIARGWKQTRPKDKLTLLPISDGGDGFGQSLANLIQAKRRVTTSCDSAHKQIHPNWWFKAKSRTAIIESAEIVGLAMLQKKERNPMHLDSKGLGRLISHCSQSGRSRQKNAKRAIIGIGGSATNDAGFGMAIELGWKFLNNSGNEITQWVDLCRLKRILPPNSKRQITHLLEKVTVAVDVQNPLLGPNGCSRVFGPQKGLRKKDMPKAEKALTRLANVWHAQTGEDAASLSGAGAAGGLGFGLHCFAGAEIRSGFEIFSEAAKLRSLLNKSDLVITGEGAMDRQTVMGKGVGELAKLSLDHDCFCIGLAGHLDNARTLRQHFFYFDALTRHTSKKEAEANSKRFLAKLAKTTAKKIATEGCKIKII